MLTSPMCIQISTDPKPDLLYLFTSYPLGFGCKASNNFRRACTEMLDFVFPPSLSHRQQIYGQSFIILGLAK